MPILKGAGNTLLCPRFGYGKRISTRAKSVNSDTGMFTGDEFARQVAGLGRLA